MALVVKDVDQMYKEQEEVEAKIRYATVKGVYFLRLRKDPNMDADVLVLIPLGTRVPVLEEKTEWIKTEYDFHKGWCKKEFLEFEEE